MPTYTYKARDAAGKSIKGSMEAISKVELSDKLHKLGYITTQVVEALPGVRLDSAVSFFQRISTEDIIMFNIQLANLIHAGVSLLASLHTLGRQIENKKLKEIVADVARNVEAGESFSEALQHHPEIFSNLFLSAVKAGEASGKLDTVLTRFAVYCEQQADLSQKIRGAFFYPAILLLAGIGVTLFIVSVIIPQFAEIFLKVGIPLPLPTLLLYKIGMGIKQFWYSLLLFALVGVLGLQYYANTSRGRLQVDRVNLGVPVLGSLFRKAAISRFARTLGMLLASGVPILQSLDIVKEVIGNKVLSGTVENVRLAVEKGEGISEPLRVSKEFPPDTIQMISVGEESGSLDEMLVKISDFYDRSVNYTVKKLTTLLEPLLLLLMGCMVGFIMASMLLPIFDMVKILKR